MSKKKVQYDIEVHLPGLDGLSDAQLKKMGRVLKPMVISHVNRNDPESPAAAGSNTIVKGDPGGSGPATNAIGGGPDLGNVPGIIKPTGH